MSDAVIVALIAAVPATIALIVGLIGTFQNIGIHKLVNSQLTSVKVELISAKQEIEELQELIVKLTGKEIAG